MDGKSFFYGVITAIILLLMLMGVGLAHIGSNGPINGNVIASGGDSMAGHHSGGAVSSNINTQVSNIDNSKLPEKCRVPAGQDIDSWVEHLGHHTETQDCLEYFN